MGNSQASACATSDELPCSKSFLRKSHAAASVDCQPGASESRCSHHCWPRPTHLLAVLHGGHGGGRDGLGDVGAHACRVVAQLVGHEQQRRLRPLKFWGEAPGQGPAETKRGNDTCTSLLGRFKSSTSLVMCPSIGTWLASSDCTRNSTVMASVTCSRLRSESASSLALPASATYFSCTRPRGAGGGGTGVSAPLRCGAEGRR